MSLNNPRGIIELGNVNIKCLIFRIRDNQTTEVLSTSITQSEGIHNGVIVNLNKASKAIRSCISIAEKHAKTFLKKWGISIKFFKKHYLRSDTIFNNDLEEPKKNFNYFFELLICKIKFFYLKLLN